MLKTTIFPTPHTLTPAILEVSSYLREMVLTIGARRYAISSNPPNLFAYYLFNCLLHQFIPKIRPNDNNFC